MSAVQMPVTPLSIIRQMPSVRIISIAPVEFSVRLQASRGFKDFTLKAAERGSWTYCDVEPELVRLPQFDDESQIGFREEYEDPSGRAQRLVSVWGYPGFVAGGRLSGRYGLLALEPGVKEPTEAQIQTLTRQQELLANTFVSHANALDERGENIHISDHHRRMAKWLLGNNAESLPWYGRKNFGMQKPCVACGEQIPQSATKCKHCSEDLVERYLRNGDEGVDDAVVKQRADGVMKHRLAKNAAIAPPPKPTESAQVAQPAQTAPGAPIAPPVNLTQRK